MDEFEARRALEVVAHSRTRLATSTDTPWWQHLLSGALMGFIYLGAGLGGSLRRPAEVTAIVIGLALIALERRRSGLTMNTLRSRDGKIVLALATLIFLPLIFLQLRMADQKAPVEWRVLVAVIASVAGLALSVIGRQIKARFLQGGGR